MAISLEIESKLDQVRLVRAAVTGILDHLRVSEADILSLELAITEIVNNSVEHGYEGAENQPIKVHIEVRDSEVQVEVIDRGRPFPETERYRLEGEPGLLEDPDDQWTARGHGLQIVRQIVDSMVLQSVGSQNVLTLCKSIVFRVD